MVTWRRLQSRKQRYKILLANVGIWGAGRRWRVGFHCWYAVWQENKVSAQKWWFENKLETLMKNLEVHEQSCSQQDRAVAAYLDDTCRLEDEAPAGRRCGKISIDAQRHLCAVCMLAFFRIEPHDPRERGREKRRNKRWEMFGVGVMSLSFEFTCI